MEPEVKKMTTPHHGQLPPLSVVKEQLNRVRQILLDLGLASAPISFMELTPYSYLFPELQDEPGALLPQGEETVEKLIALGHSMKEPAGDPKDSTIPAAYTYFGQFFDHDVTQELHSDRMIRSLNDPKLEPLSRAEIDAEIKNARTPTLDLDCIFGTMANGDPVPQREERLLLGAVTASGHRPKNKNAENDLPRLPSYADARVDRKALIGDARNDENLIISQLHVAFLRAQRVIVGHGHTFDEARMLLRQHYQWLVINDYLMRIADNDIVNGILTHGNRVFRPSRLDMSMPLEFSAAAFRFGHSMVRSEYQYNVNFMGDAALGLGQLFTRVIFRNGIHKESPTLPESLIIQWEEFLDGGANRARRIDTRVVEPLSSLTGEDGQRLDGTLASLAARNLLRGYLLRLPVGEMVARALGFKPLSPGDIASVAEKANPSQKEVLSAPLFKNRTPLWYYILAEAAATAGNKLGPVGSTIVAEVLIGMVRRSADSILAQPDWKPTLGKKPGVFNLFDFFLLADVWR